MQLAESSGEAAKEYLYNSSAETAASWVRTAVLALARPLKLTAYALPWFAQPPEEHLLEILSAGFNTAWGSFWGRFGSLNVALPVIWEELWKVVSVVALVGVALWLIRQRHGGSPLRFYIILLIVGVMASAAQIFLPLLNRPNPNWWPQGRFLLPIAMPLMLLLYLGWSDCSAGAFPSLVVTRGDLVCCLHGWRGSVYSDRAQCIADQNVLHSVTLPSVNSPLDAMPVVRSLLSTS